MPAASRGYDGGKKVPGRKRHVVTDTLGLLLAVAVAAANIGDRDAAGRFLPLLQHSQHRRHRAPLAHGAETRRRMPLSFRATQCLTSRNQRITFGWDTASQISSGGRIGRTRTRRTRRCPRCSRRCR
ncbi:transposase [Streptomyces sp. NPDC059999]|uniref:transposase n=1 Tax=Streptomyces sp. NPDC059999 TaxID=3347030 RepID=UPI00368A7A85